MAKLLKDNLNKHYLAFAIILFVIFIFRFPSLFEPFWYGDEGIFAAVARNLNLGGVLYQTAWDNKPPMIYLTYAGIFSIFGVSMFWLRFVASVAVLATAGSIYEIAKTTLSSKRALIATFIFGFLTSLRLIEGNLALTEIFMILPITIAMMIVILRKFDYFSLFGAGILFAIASLYKQVGAFETAALGIYLFLAEENFWNFFKKGLILSVGFLIPYLATIGYFASKGLLSDYIFGAYTYYRIYLGESPKYAIFINIAKFLPVLAAIFYGFYKKFRLKEINIFHLFLLWTAFSFLGSYFSGRTYGHYLVQATPGLALLLGSVNYSKFKVESVRIIFAVFFIVPLLYLTSFIFSDFLSGGPINQIKYWQNFITFASGKKSVDEYNNYFDGNVNTIMALSDFLKVNGGFGKSIYIWGDYPWLYALTDAKNPSRYVTSFHVFGVPNGPKEVSDALLKNYPEFIVKSQSSIGFFDELEKLIAKKYTFLAKINTVEVFILKSSK